MQHYRVVVCECGCEYNPMSREACPACGRDVPEDPAVIEERLAAAEEALAAKKKIEKDSEAKAMEKARKSRKSTVGSKA